MPFVTVIGASSRPYSISISGDSANTLGQHVSQSASSLSSSTSASSDSVSGSSSTQDTVSSTAQDTISAVGTSDTSSSSASPSFLGGTGSTSTVSGASSLYSSSSALTSSSASSIQYSGGNVIDLGPDSNTPSNVLFDASTTNTSLLMYAGANDTILGGSGADTIAANYLNSPTTAGAEYQGTFSGGSGAANLFEFLHDSGGHYTITDFGSAAGNLVGIQATDAEIQKMLDTATISGGNTTIQLQDNTQITFLDDTHLKRDDFKNIT